MKNYIIIYNPNSGKGKGYKKAIKIGVELCYRGIEKVSLFETKSQSSTEEFFKDLSKNDSLQDYVIIVIGGDGTLGSTIHSIVANDLECEVAVYPHGTANDFATSLKASKNIKRFVDLLLDGKAKDVDVANINGYYAINAIGGGNFSHGAEVYSPGKKKMWGKIAYYAHCFLTAFTMKSQKLVVNIDDEEYIDNFLFYYIVNSNTAGGFKNFAPTAQLADGQFVFVGIKKCSFIPFCFLFLNILLGKHGKSKRVLMKKGQRFKITPVPPVNKKFIGSDLDGNVGPQHPLNVRVIRRFIKIYTK